MEATTTSAHPSPGARGAGVEAVPQGSSEEEGASFHDEEGAAAGAEVSSEGAAGEGRLMTGAAGSSALDSGSVGVAFSSASAGTAAAGAETGGGRTGLGGERGLWGGESVFRGYRSGRGKLAWQCEPKKSLIQWELSC